MNKSVIVHDISFYQDKNDTDRKVDFAKMKASGAKGVIIRAGQGSYVDEDFQDYYTASKGILPRGVYWFYDSRVPPLAQARQFATLIINAGLPEMEIWLDYEENYGGAYHGWKNFAVFADEVMWLLPACKIGIYTNYYYWQEHCPNWLLQAASFKWFARFPLWLAWYTDNDALVKIPAPWTECLYWQYSSHGDGLAAGVESLNIDCNFYQGTQLDFDLRYKLSGEPTPPPSEVDTQPVVIPQPTKPGVGLYRVKHDVERTDFKVPYQARNYVKNWDPKRKLRGLPETCRLFGGRGSVTLSIPWVKFFQKINSANAYRYNQKLKSGWVNAGPWPRVECLTFGGNVVDVYEIDGFKAYVRTYVNGETPPSADWLMTKVQRFSVVYNDGSVEMCTPVGNVFTFLIANPGEKLWMDLNNLVKV